MATVIRMKRGGRTHAPYYRVVVADARAKITGSVIEQLGIYHPCARPEPVIKVNREKALEWLGKGAQPTDTVRDILSKMGVMAEFHASKTQAKDGAGSTSAASSEAETN